MKEDWISYTTKSKYVDHKDIGVDEAASIDGDRYFCLTCLATCISCQGCDKKGE